MDLNFINNIHELVMDSEGSAWQYRHGQDQQIVAEQIAGDLLKKYRGHSVANTKYTGNGSYARLEPKEKAIVDIIIMNNINGLIS